MSEQNPVTMDEHDKYLVAVEIAAQLRELIQHHYRPIDGHGAGPLGGDPLDHISVDVPNVPGGGGLKVVWEVSADIRAWAPECSRPALEGGKE